MKRIKHITCKEGVQKALELFEKNRIELAADASDDRWEAPTLPVLVGAGVSVSAGIPLNAALLTSISKKSNRAVADYKALYNLLNDTLAKDYKHESYMKPRLRRWLEEGGIPRQTHRPLPNSGTLLLMHLLHNHFIGPIISLNVDPLLSISSMYFDHTLASKVKFIQNASQFSDLLDSSARDNAVIFQPHGTIEEPLSLRFAEDELIGRDSENAIREALVRAVSARVALLSIGVNLFDGVASRLIAEWVASNKQRNLQLLTTAHETLHNEELVTLEALTSAHENLEVYIAEGVDSDLFWAAVVKAAVAKTLENRANSHSLYHVPEASELQFQLQMHEKLYDELRPKGNFMYRRIPNYLDWIILEICIHSVISRGPFTIRDLVRNCSSRGALASLFETPDGIKQFSNAIRRLQQRKIIEVVGAKSSYISDVDIFPYNNIEDINSILLQRSEHLNTPEDFLEAIHLVLDLKSCRSGELLELLKSIELDRETDIRQIDAIPSHLYFENSEILESHFQLNVKLDELKAKFAKAVKAGSEAHCMIVTESGEHLFQNDKIVGMKSLEDFRAQEIGLPDIVRSWLMPLLDVGAGESQSLSIIIAEQEPRWVFEHAERSERDKIIRELMEMLDRAPSIDVRVLPWHKHDDHMWVLQLEGGRASEGVLFPRPHGQQSYFGLHVVGETDVNKLTSVFERHDRDAYPVNHEKVHHVVALTIVDKSATAGADGSVCRDDRVLIGVRRPETNRQHANIACVPTTRIPPAIFEDIAGAIRGVSKAEPQTMRLQSGWVSNLRGGGNDPIAYAVASLMCAKLDLADALEHQRISYRATPRVVKSGYSPLLTDEDRPEYLAMLNILVMLDTGRDELPKQTASYSRLQWVRVGDFLDALGPGGSKGQLSLGEDSEKTTFECGGVCVCTTEVLLSAGEGL